MQDDVFEMDNKCGGLVLPATLRPRPLRGLRGHVAVRVAITVFHADKKHACEFGRTAST